MTKITITAVYRYVALAMLPYVTLMALNTPEFGVNSDSVRELKSGCPGLLDSIDDIGMELGGESEDDDVTNSLGGTFSPAVLLSTSICSVPVPTFAELVFSSPPAPCAIDDDVPSPPPDMIG